MLTQPKVEYRDEQPYAAIRTKVAMQAIPKDLPPLIHEILQWVKTKKLKQEGPVFFYYLSMDRGTMDVDVGVPVSEKPQGDGRVIAGSFPAAKYLTARHTGPYNDLPKSHSSLDSYAKKHGLKGTTRAELYITDPAEEKDQSKWETDLLLLLED
jgi:effector-binding domain-containing protein